ncbi:heavy metal-binding domain-containing protein [Ponticaulis sp.]|uniref:YbjQ family protein n=1 Tax=Ponticaulis sp. TaxID=2020902 RepID=UPI00261DCCE7|nr:heavy metal-binding domain-containing protein [Ponticaulis sp.]MDF1681579.1 heavy metal-binding domain-containing protein [Ponticaulis sp.]
MIITTTETIPGREISEVIGIAKGNVVRARFVGRDIIAGFRTLVGGEVDEYTKLMAEAREQSYDRMLESARQMGADAVVNVRFTTSLIMQGSSEIMTYGTAVRLK